MESCNGKVDILNYKGKYKNMMPWLASRMNIYKEETGGIQVEETEDGMKMCIRDRRSTGDGSATQT